MPPVRPPRSLALALLVTTLLLRAAAPVDATQVRYRWPVEDAQVVAPFVAPDTPYGPGHRGVDLAVTAGAQVGAAAAGRVTFAGAVAGTSWVSVEHPDGLRTSVGPLRTLAVRSGATVAPGTLLGTASGEAHGAADLLHLSIRRGEDYLDPVAIIAVAPRVTLVPGGRAEAARTPAVVRPRLLPGPPSPSHLITLAGLGSEAGEVPVDVVALGYRSDDTSAFRYDGDERYDASDTWGRVRGAALALREQLRQQWREHPGQAVDLVGHSLGGLVAMYYLLVLHDPADPTLPAIGRVVTISSPLDGTELADALTLARRDPVARALIAVADAFMPSVDADAPVLDDLGTSGEAVQELRDAWNRARRAPHLGPLATGTQILTIGGVLDPVVPEHRTRLGGEEHRSVLDTHRAAPTNHLTTDWLAAFLAGEPLPDGGFSAQAAQTLAPLSHVVGLVELVAGALA